MKEVALMDSSKQTDNKLRWQADVDGVNFKLYIPKWRVPRPWPSRITVCISDVEPHVDRETSPFTVTNSPLEPLLEQPIVAIADRVSDHTQTARFAPRGDPKEWQIGEPYIPYSLLPDSSVRTVHIEVRWDRSAGTWSDE